MVAVYMVPAKVDISFLLRSRDEEEETARTTAVTTSTVTETIMESTAGPDPTPVTTATSTIPGFHTEGVSSPTTTSSSTVSSVSSRRLQPALSTRSAPAKKNSKWSKEEDNVLIGLRANETKWDDCGKVLSGRTGMSCRLHYQNYLERRYDWDEDGKNKLARLYERYKKEMWSIIAKEMQIPWRAIEAMHWEMGRDDMAERAGVAPFTISHPTSEPPAKIRRVNSRTSRPRRESGQQSNSNQLPSVAELSAGVPAYAPQPPQPPREHHPRRRSSSNGNQTASRPGVTTRSRS